MFRKLFVVALAAAVLSPAVTSAAPAKKRDRHWHGYGFLPGYPPSPRDYRSSTPDYWWGGPQFYRGRWNGGGFGPCWKTTPIGPIWTCG